MRDRILFLPLVIWVSACQPQIKVPRITEITTSSDQVTMLIQRAKTQIKQRKFFSAIRTMESCPAKYQRCRDLLIWSRCHALMALRMPNHWKKKLLSNWRKYPQGENSKRCVESAWATLARGRKPIPR